MKTNTMNIIENNEDKILVNDLFDDNNPIVVSEDDVKSEELEQPLGVGGIDTPKSQPNPPPPPPESQPKTKTIAKKPPPVPKSTLPKTQKKANLLKSIQEKPKLKKSQPRKNKLKTKPLNKRANLMNDLRKKRVLKS